MYRYELSMTNPLESKSAGVGGWVSVCFPGLRLMEFCPDESGVSMFVMS